MSTVTRSRLALDEQQWMCSQPCPQLPEQPDPPHVLFLTSRILTSSEHLHASSQAASWRLAISVLPMTPTLALRSGRGQLFWLWETRRAGALMVSCSRQDWSLTLRWWTRCIRQPAKGFGFFPEGSAQTLLGYLSQSGSCHVFCRTFSIPAPRSLLFRWHTRTPSFPCLSKCLQAKEGKMVRTARAKAARALNALKSNMGVLCRIPF